MRAKMTAPALLLLLAMAACHGDLYPIAPEPPERQTVVGSPAPGVTPAPSEPGPYGGQLVVAGDYRLELVSFTPRQGAYTLYLFPWTAGMQPVPFNAGAKASLKLSNGQTITLSGTPHSEDGSLFFYAFPAASFRTLDVTLQAEVTLGAASLTAAFDHPDR